MEETFLQASFATLEEAEAAARSLSERGVPASSIQVLEGAEPRIEAPAPVGPALGFGVTPEATNALVEEHLAEAVEVTEERVYVLNVNTNGDANQLQAARDFFGYVS